MKINIEGAEIRVLNLANLDNIDQIIVEFHLFMASEENHDSIKKDIEKVLKRIAKFGFKMKQIDDTSPAYFFYK